MQTKKRLTNQWLMTSSTWNHGPYLEVIMLVKGVQVSAERPGKQDRLLRDDAELGAQVLQTDFADVNAVNQDFPIACLVDAEESEECGTLAGTCAPADTDLDGGAV